LDAVKRDLAAWWGFAAAAPAMLTIAFRSRRAIFPLQSVKRLGSGELDAGAATDAADE